MTGILEPAVFIGVVGSGASILGLSDQCRTYWRAAKDCDKFKDLVEDLEVSVEVLEEALQKNELPLCQNGELEPMREILSRRVAEAGKCVEEAQRHGKERMPSAPWKRNDYLDKMKKLRRKLIKHNHILQKTAQNYPIIHWSPSSVNQVQQSNQAQNSPDQLAAFEEKMDDRSEEMTRTTTPTSPTSLDTERMDLENADDDNSTVFTGINQRSMPGRTLDAIEDHMGSIIPWIESETDEEIRSYLKLELEYLANLLPRDRPKVQETNRVLSGDESHEDRLAKLAQDWTLSKEELQIGSFVVRTEGVNVSDRRNRVVMSARQDDKWRELSILTTLAEHDLRHDCVHRFLGYMDFDVSEEHDRSKGNAKEDFTGYSIVFEPNPLGRLDGLLRTRIAGVPGSNEYVSTVLYEILLGAARGLEFMHVYGILHRDVRPENLFITTCDSGLGLKAKIGNFATAKDLDSRITHTVLHSRETIEDYIAPEACSGDSAGKAKYSYPADYWSFGKILEVSSHQLFEDDQYLGRQEALQPIISRCRAKLQHERYGRRTTHEGKLSKDLAEVRREHGKEYTGRALMFVRRLREVLATDVLAAKGPEVPTPEPIS